MEDQKVGGRHNKTSKLILKEFQDTNYKSFSDGQITITFPHDDDLTHVKVVLTPTGGLYAGATVAFTLRLPASYPNEIATVQCVSKILHPNISKTGAVCFNVFGGTTLLSTHTLFSHLT
jgi:ubiquitin-protein ligase